MKAGIRSSLGLESRVVFRLPSEARIVPLTLNSLLDWSCHELSLVPTAIPNVGLRIPTNDNQVVSVTPPKKPSTKVPGVTETSLILPQGFSLSPHRFTKWTHNGEIPKQTISKNKDGIIFSQTIEIWETSASVSNDFVAVSYTHLTLPTKA